MGAFAAIRYAYDDADRSSTRTRYTGYSAEQQYVASRRLQSFSEDSLTLTITTTTLDSLGAKTGSALSVMTVLTDTDALYESRTVRTSLDASGAIVSGPDTSFSVVQYTARGDTIVRVRFFGNTLNTEDLVRRDMESKVVNANGDPVYTESFILFFFDPDSGEPTSALRVFNYT